jgi:hypothetical protein
MRRSDWRRHWIVDLGACTVTHDSGFTVRVALSPDGDATDFVVHDIDPWQERMLQHMPFPDVVAYAKQLLYEAVEVYKAAQADRH